MASGARRTDYRTNRRRRYRQYTIYAVLPYVHVPQLQVPYIVHRRSTHSAVHEAHDPVRDTDRHAKSCCLQRCMQPKWVNDGARRVLRASWYALLGCDNPPTGHATIHAGTLWEGEIDERDETVAPSHEMGDAGDAGGDATPFARAHSAISSKLPSRARSTTSVSHAQPS